MGFSLVPLSFRFGVRFGVINLDICRNTGEALDKPTGLAMVHSRQPAFIQSLAVQGVVVMTVASPVPLSQPQLSSRKTREG
jgi:hypothetical protein